MLFTVTSSICVVVVGALLHYYFTRKHKYGEELRALRNHAYLDFISSASRIIAARRIGLVKDDMQDLVMLNNAKTRIVVYGEAAVVKELAEFWEYGATLEREQEILAFTRLCFRMRQSVGYENDEIYDIKISQLLFKLEPASFSFIKDGAKDKAS